MRWRAPTCWRRSPWSAALGAWQLAASWDLLADALGIEPFLSRPPRDRGIACGTTASCSPTTRWVTLQEVVLGLALALVIGYGFAVALHLSAAAAPRLLPPLVASQTVPVIAIAPILIVWFGFGIGPKLAIIALVCFFPVTVNTPRRPPRRWTRRWCG